MISIKLAAFDMDGTILEEDSSWAALHRHFKTTKGEGESLRLYTNGKIDYEEFMRRDIVLWPKGLEMSEVERILSNYKIRHDAPSAIKKLKDRGATVAIVTAGIDILAKKVAQDLGADAWVANGLRFDVDGKLTAEGIANVDPLRKDIAFLKLLKEFGISPRETIAVGDTMYDISFLKAAGRGFLLSPKEDEKNLVIGPNIIKIHNLSDIFHYID
jgi:phosphoserine phosphatase